MTISHSFATRFKIRVWNLVRLSDEKYTLSLFCLLYVNNAEVIFTGFYRDLNKKITAQHNILFTKSQPKKKQNTNFKKKNTTGWFRGVVFWKADFYLFNFCDQPGYSQSISWLSADGESMLSSVLVLLLLMLKEANTDGEKKWDFCDSVKGNHLTLVSTA